MAPNIKKGSHPSERKYAVITGSESSERDPVCGMTVDRSNLQASFGDSVYYFCSKDCRDRFEANPSYFVRPLAS